MQALKAEDLTGTRVELPPYAATRSPPMVGRNVEWERLVGCWRLATEGEAHFALIMGEPGIGKSRLAEALLDSCSRDSNRPYSSLSSTLLKQAKKRSYVKRMQPGKPWHSRCCLSNSRELLFSQTRTALNRV
jgi:DNA-binding NtrC family response regulator